MLTGAFSTICLIRFSSPCRASLENLSEASWPIDPQGGEPRRGDLHGLGREEVERADDLAVAHHGQGDRRLDPGAARQRGAAAVVQLAEVGDVEQVAEPPGPAVEALSLAEPRRARQPLELVVDPARLQREDQRVLHRIDRPVRRVGPAELLADRVQRGADDLVDRLGPDDRVDRVDHGLGVGVGLRQERLRLLGDVQRRGRRRGPRLVDDASWRPSLTDIAALVLLAAAGGSAAATAGDRAPVPVPITVGHRAVHRHASFRFDSPWLVAPTLGIRDGWLFGARQVGFRQRRLEAGSRPRSYATGR